MAVSPSFEFQPLLSPTIFPVVTEKTLKDLFHSITIDLDTCIMWLQSNGLLATGMLCKCGSIMRSGAFSGVAEGKGWRCTDKSCRKFASLRIGSFFEGSNLPLTEFVKNFVFLGRYFTINYIFT